MKHSKYLSLFFIFAAYLVTFSYLSAGDTDNEPIDVNSDGAVNILVIGSTHSFSDGGEFGVVHEKPFNPTAITTHLQSILAQDSTISETVNVVFDDIFKTKSQTVDYSGSSQYEFTSHCYTLAQHYMWPEGKAARLSNLRGANGTVWDHVIIMSDPYVMANFPGMYAEGVKMVVGEVKKGVAKPMLFAQWPENTSTFTALNFNEVVYRVGKSAEVNVVPGGKAWSSLANQDTSSNHPTAKGAYLAAASIYSRICNVSAKTSAYIYADAPTTNAISDHALSVVLANQNAVQYAGAYAGNNVFSMKYVTKRNINFRETGTSTEDRLRQALGRVDDLYRVSLTTGGTFWDFNYGRGNDWWEDEKDYEVNPAKHDRAYGFPMHHYKVNSALNTMPYGIDKHYYFGSSYEDGTDLGIAYNMIRPGGAAFKAANNGNGTRELSLPADVRAIPVRLMWLKMLEQSPGFNPLGDNTHMNNNLNDASAAFMYTLLSGRCPVVEEPTPVGSAAWLQWLGHKVGYETAWQMSHLTTRSPGFRVLPSATNAKTITPTTSEIMTVQFASPPKNNVTVNVSLSNPDAAIVGPQLLVFTPQNYNTPQNIVVAGVEGGALSADFNVIYNTVSDDEIYDGLTDSWAYTINRSSTQSLTTVNKGTTQVSVFKNTPKTISLNTSGAVSGNTEFAGPNNGSLIWSGSSVLYTPNPEFTGKDGFAFSVNDGITITRGYIEIDVLDAAQIGTVSYNGNTNTGGVAPTDSNNYNENDIVTVLANTGLLVKNGHSFEGWNTAANNTGTSYDGGDTFSMGASGVILYAQWTPDTYTITYDRNGVTTGTVPAIQSKTHDVDIIVSGNTGNLAISGQQFVGWNLAANGSGQSFAGGVTFSLNQDAILYAQWNSAPEVNAGGDQTVTLSDPEVWAPQFLNPSSWYDASDAASVIVTGGAVSEWRDKSGNDFHALQSSAGSRPATGTNTMGGLNVITFDGTSDVLNLNLDYLANKSHSAFVMTKTTGFTDIYGAANSNSSSNSLHVGFSSTTSFRMNYWGNDWGQSIGGSFNAAEGNILNFVWGSGTTKQIFANGVSQGTRTGAGVIGTMAGGGRLGQVVNHGYYGGDIAEVVFVTGDVEPEDRERMEGYLAHKWGVTDGLGAVHPYKNSVPLITVATASLSGTAVDADGDAMAYSWSVVGDSSNVRFSNPTGLATDVSFTKSGTYLLRLTADDGVAQPSEDVEIIVSEPLPGTYDSWAERDFTNTFTDKGIDADQDGDGLRNGMEFGFGTDPTLNDSLPLLPDGSRHGLPIIVSSDGGVTFDLLFVRRDVYGVSGSAKYTPQFSSDMKDFHDSSAVPTFVADSSVDSDYEIVKVPFTALLPNSQKAKFGRVQVEMVP